MPRIYISYRRTDAHAYAGRLYDQLSARFGSESVFLDVSAIEPGADFSQVINDAVRSSDVLLVIIGPSWLSDRIEDPGDFIRIEVATALAAGIRVVPVLVDGARMPSPGDLPGDLAELAVRQAIVLEATAWRTCSASSANSSGRSAARKRRPAAGCGWGGRADDRRRNLIVRTTARRPSVS